MRVKFTFSFERNLILPIHYNHIIQGLIYNHIKDQRLQIRYHEQGFMSGNKRFKLFTFSRIYGNYKIDKEKNNIVFSSPISITVSGIEDVFVSELIQGIISSEDLYINGTKVEVNGFVPIYVNLNKSNIQLEMMSPVTVYRAENRNGKRFTNYVSPHEVGFGELIAHNLIEKFQVLYPSERIEMGKIAIKPMFQDAPQYQKVIRFKDTIIKAWMGSFRLMAPPKILELAYYGGLGAKNSEGFGCFRIFGTGEK
ncbi:MAG: CRISPR-associated endoribonuclease Cas6 [Thermoplasmataceae archaeon]